MDTLQTFRQRITWTRTWLNTSNNEKTTEPETEDFEIIDPSNIPNSDYGVESLSDHTSLQRESTTPKLASIYSDFTDWDLPELCRECGYYTLCCSWCCCTNSQCMSNHLQAQTFFDPFLGWTGLGRLEETSCRKDAIDYELAGRGVEKTFRDSRSAAKARRRKRTEREKYFSFENVKPGWLGTEQHELYPQGSWFGEMVCPWEAPVVTMTKQRMYREAQNWPKPPTYHRRPRHKDYYPWSNRYDKRMKSRKHARQMLVGDVEMGEILDPAGGWSFHEFPIDEWDCDCADFDTQDELSFDDPDYPPEGEVLGPCESIQDADGEVALEND